ncbi:MAG TPA: IS1380 family transposase [Planctomycetota bacterium]|nr:IS1380 family transposase [Planctomycetota bacterium]
MTECSQPSFHFAGPRRREVVARFDGGTISSDGGALLLGEVERRLHILERFAGCFLDHRDPSKVEHQVGELVSQRVLGLCLGYEDLCDHDQLRQDPLLGLLSGKAAAGSCLAGKSTLSRLELSRSDMAAEDRYKRIALDTAAIDALLVDAFLESHAQPPASIVIDLDATDFAIHGRQEGRFFHGFYDHYCYLPLYIFCGEHLLCARLRRSDIDASQGTLDEIPRIVEQVRARWPEVRITLRADSGFCREAIMAWCEGNGVEYAFGLARNERLQALVRYAEGLAAMDFAATGKPQRRFEELEYRTLDSWSRSRRVVAKVEYTAKGFNPRFVVTSLERAQIDARPLYEELYCARGDMENRIKEQQLGLFAERVSAQTMAANQVRLYFASVGYVLMHALRRLGLVGTELERAQCDTIRVRLLKIGARVKTSVRRVVVSLSEAFPLQELFARVLDHLRAGGLSSA